MSQHHAYRRALEGLGCRVLSLPAEPTQPDSVFVEDVAIVLDIRTRLYADIVALEGLHEGLADALAFQAAHRGEAGRRRGRGTLLWTTNPDYAPGLAGLWTNG